MKTDLTIISNFLLNTSFNIYLKDQWLDSYQKDISSIKISGNWFTGVFNITIRKILKGKIIISIPGYFDDYEINLPDLKNSIL